jgi:hypothetical protein
LGAGRQIEIGYRGDQGDLSSLLFNIASVTVQKALAPRLSCIAASRLDDRMEFGAVK